MSILNLSSLNVKNINDLYYMESLSFDNLPDGSLKIITDGFKKNKKQVGKNFQKNFNGALEAFDFNNNSLSYQFQVHDCYDPEINVLLDKDVIKLKTISNSFKDFKEYDIDVLFKKLSNFQSKLSTYSHGLLVETKDCNFDVVFGKKDFSFRDFLIIDNEKLEPEIIMVFVHYKDIRHSDLGDREILVLQFTPEEVIANIQAVPQLKNKNSLR